MFRTRFWREPEADEPTSKVSALLSFSAIYQLAEWFNVVKKLTERRKNRGEERNSYSRSVYISVPMYLCVYADRK